MRNIATILITLARRSCRKSVEIGTVDADWHRSVVMEDAGESSDQCRSLASVLFPPAAAPDQSHVLHVP